MAKLKVTYETNRRRLNSMGIAEDQDVAIVIEGVPFTIEEMVSFCKQAQAAGKEAAREAGEVKAEEDRAKAAAEA